MSSRPFPWTVAGLVLILGSAGSLRGAPASFDGAASDPRAVAVADRVLEALGGRRAWEETRFVRFAFVVRRGGTERGRRLHLWDRWEGRLRYEREDAEGRPLVVLLDLKSRRGEAFRSGDRLGEDEAGPLLKEAYEAWINDTYWLLMPYKMKDPGVRLAYAGETAVEGTTYDRVGLSFGEGIGLTPGDRYWAYVSRRTGLVDRWEYILEGDPPDRPPTAWAWRGWTRRGRILLSPEKVLLGGRDEVRILHPVLEVYDTLPDEYFSRPDPLPPTLGP
ncbi:MAG: hypothetical protein ACE5JH_10390 [Acidobacteriota bacterium]